MKYPCGCINEPDPASGVTKAVFKCARHKARMGRGGLAYYEELGCLKDGKAIPTNHIKEFKVALELMGAEPLKGGMSLEIGAGVGTYIPWLEGEGFVCAAIEPDREAAEFIWFTYKVPVFINSFEGYTLQNNQQFDLILAAHVIEHFKDSPTAISMMFDLLKPGGRALLLVPEGTDGTNPDHLWFYTPENLVSTVRRAGFTNVQMAVQAITKKERFIYVSAYKPVCGADAAKLWVGLHCGVGCTGPGLGARHSSTL